MSTSLISERRVGHSGHRRRRSRLTRRCGKRGWQRTDVEERRNIATRIELLKVIAFLLLLALVVLLADA